MGKKSNSTERRDQITWALYDCLAKRGHEKVTIKGIATQAGLQPGVIHYYFKNKDEIVSNLTEALAKKYSNQLSSRVKKAASSEQKIIYAIDTIIDELIFNLPLNRVFYNLTQMTFERKQLRCVIQDFFKSYRRLLSDVFKSAGAGTNSYRLGAFLLALSEGFAIQFMVEPDALKKEDVQRVIIQAIKDRLNIKKLLEESV